MGNETTTCAEPIREKKGGGDKFEVCSASRQREVGFSRGEGRGGGDP